MKSFTLPAILYLLFSIVPSSLCYTKNLYTKAHNGRSFERVFESANSLAKSIGMEECGQMAICDAHARYSDYGLLALPLVLLFPGSRTDSGEPASEWQEAALRGKAREECYSRYNCMVNPMWIVNFLLKIFVY